MRLDGRHNEVTARNRGLRFGEGLRGVALRVRDARLQPRVDVGRGLRQG